jgi:RNA-binding protein 26
MTFWITVSTLCICLRFPKCSDVHAETSQFVDRLFTTLKSKSFKTSTTNSPKPAPITSKTAPAPAPAPTASSSTSKDSGIPIPLDALLTSKSDSRGTKRRLDSDTGPGDQSRSPPKGPRLRDSTVSRYDSSNGPGRSENGARGYRDERDRVRDRDSRNGVRSNAPPTAPAAERDDRREERNSKRQPCRDYHGECHPH